MPSVRKKQGKSFWKRPYEEREPAGKERPCEDKEEALRDKEEALRDKEEAKANEKSLREILKKAGIDPDE